jgi:hypothetical protein
MIRAVTSIGLNMTGRFSWGIYFTLGIILYQEWIAAPPVGPRPEAVLTLHPFV